MSNTGSKSLLAPCDVGHPWLDMAASVLIKAVMDWETYGQCTDCNVSDRAYSCDLRWRLGFDSPREELIAFFSSDWFRFLLDGFSVECDAVMEELRRKGVPYERTDR